MIDLSKVMLLKTSSPEFMPTLLNTKQIISSMDGMKKTCSNIFFPPNSLLYLISKLEPREQQVVKLRFMERKSLDEIGEIVSVTRERVRQILAHVQREIRTPWNWRFIRYGIVGYVEHISKYNYDQGYNDGYEMARLEIEKGVETIEREKILSEPIEVLKLSMRSHNGMIKKGCHIVADVIKLTSDDIDGIRNFGFKSATETANKLKAIGITGTAWDKYL